LISLNTSVERQRGQSTRFQAAGYSTPIAEVQVQTGVLKVKGFCLDTIDGLGGAWSDWSPGWKSGNAVAQPRLQRSIYGTAEDTYHAIWKTVMAGYSEIRQDDFAKLFARQCCYLEAAYQQNIASHSHGDLASIEIMSPDFDTPRPFNSWYLKNQCMTFGCKTLQSWTETFNQVPSNVGGIVHPIQHKFWPEFESAYLDANYHRRMVTTTKGYIGLAPEQTSPGDIVCFFLGGRMPVILRPVDQHWEFIGECYIHGVMFGEAIDDLENGQYELRDFEIH
jgi:hypothetical protein